MKNVECESMTTVMMAMKTGQWTDSLRRHASGCQRCQETMATVVMMKDYAAKSPTHVLPNHRLIFLKARFARKEKQFTRFDFLVLTMLSSCVIAGLVGLFLLMYPQLLGSVLGVPGTAASRLTSILSGRMPVLVLLGVAVMTWILTRDSIFAER